MFKNRSHLEAKIKPNIKHPVGCFTLFLQLMVELELQKNTFQKEKKSCSMDSKVLLTLKGQKTESDFYSRGKYYSRQNRDQFSAALMCRIVGDIISRRIVLQDKYNKREGS